MKKYIYIYFHFLLWKFSKSGEHYVPPLMGAGGVQNKNVKLCFCIKEKLIFFLFLKFFDVINT